MKKTHLQRAAAITMAALMAGTALAGCNGGSASKAEGGDATKSEASTGGKGSVYWLNFKPEIDETLQALAKKYKEAKGVDVKVVTAASGTYSETLTAEMDKSNPPTMFVIGNQQGVKDWGD